MIIDILTLFPSMLSGPFSESIVKRAQEKGLVKINIHNLRDWAIDERGTVDDRPYGGGRGMILRPEPIFNAVESIKETRPRKTSEVGELAGECKIVLLTPQGQLFNQQKAYEFSKLDQLILICGHYEGVDERVREHLVDEEISIGDYVLTGGEIPAMVIADAVTRLLPGVLEKEATSQESFQNSFIQSPGLNNGIGKELLEYPQYTRPEDFRGLKAPEILLSGNHKEIEKWRKRKAVERTKKRRPELLT